MDSTEDSSTKCKFFVKKNQSNRRIRNVRRDSSSSGDSDQESAVVTNSSRKSHSNPLIQSTNAFNKLKKRKIVSERDLNEDNDSNDDSFRLTYRSKKMGQSEGPADMGATAVIQTETDKAVDAQSIFERAQEVNKSLKGQEDDHIYRGMNNAITYRTKKDTPQGNASSGFNRKGPVRAPENIRSTVRWDYQPDLCKDYKETGFCGFGDSCIFLHDRTDYKSGWQLEMDVQHKDQQFEDPNKYVIADDDDLPFKCLICRESFKSPVVTKCKHYFCEKCALKHFQKSSRCYVCGNQTMGVFNTAKDIIKRLNTENEGSDADKEIPEPNEEPSQDSDSD